MAKEASSPKPIRKLGKKRKARHSPAPKKSQGPQVTMGASSRLPPRPYPQLPTSFPPPLAATPPPTRPRSAPRVDTTLTQLNSAPQQRAEGAKPYRGADPSIEYDSPVPLPYPEYPAVTTDPTTREDSTGSAGPKKPAPSITPGGEEEEDRDKHEDRF
jgi:hypothetical protein